MRTIALDSNPHMTESYVDEVEVPLKVIKKSSIETTFFVTLEEEAELFWTEEMCSRCVTAGSVEVHLPRKTGEVHKNFFTFLSCNHGVLKMDLKLHHSDMSRKDTYQESFATFDLCKAKEPVFINEDGWNCLWFGFDGGHVVIYFPESKTKPIPYE